MKILWVKQAVPDTYVHSSFLSQLRHNQNVVKYEYKMIIYDASVLLVNIDLAVIFILSFVTIYHHDVDPRMYVAAATVPDLILLNRYMWDLTLRARLTLIKSGLVTIFSILLLTPVFRSLTESTSSDSIWALSGWLLLLNVTMSSRKFPALSTNTSLAAIIVLASRLRTSLEVFYFVLFNTQSFVVIPYAYKWLKIQESSGLGCVSLISLLLIASCALIRYIFGWMMTLLWLIVQLMVLLGLPALFLSLQKYKDRISGPWDPARPDL